MDINISKLIITTQSQDIFNWGSFWTALLGAGFGALSAYWLNRRSAEIKEKITNINNLRILIQFLSSQLYVFLDLKEKGINPKLAELKKIKQDFKTGEVKMHHVLSIVMHDIVDDFDLTKIEYFIKNEPNLYHSMAKHFNNSKILNRLIIEYNSYIKQLQNENQNKKIDMCGDVLETLIKNLETYISNLEGQINGCIWTGKKSIDNLVIYGIDYFGAVNVFKPDYSDEQVAIFNSLPSVGLWYEVKPRTFIKKHLPTFLLQYRRIKSKFKKGGK